jgi:hypothetical protein
VTQGARSEERAALAADVRTAEAELELAEGWVRNVWASIAWDRAEDHHPLGERGTTRFHVARSCSVTSLPGT